MAGTEADRPLSGAVCVVAGATRGAGRGIAVELGAAGATVYATGRSVRGNPSPMARPETLEETAELIDAAGGRGIAVRCDHTDAAQVAGLAARIREEQDGRLDVLVNDIWGGDPLADWGKPFWEHSLEDGLLMQRLAVTTHVITSWHLAPLLVERGRGLVVEITDGDRPDYRGSFFYDLAKATVIRLAVGQAADLKPHGVAAVALTPGFLRSEAMLDYFGVAEENWRDAIAQDRHYSESETPHFVGRAVAALAADPDVMAKTGQTLASWTLSREYGFDDIDGRRPDWGAYYERVVLGETAELPAGSDPALTPFAPDPARPGETRHDPTAPPRTAGSPFSALAAESRHDFGSSGVRAGSDPGQTPEARSELAGDALLPVDGVGDVHRVLGLVPAPEHQAGVGLHRVLPRRNQLAGEHELAALHLEVPPLLLLDPVHEHLERALDVDRQRHA